MPFFSDSLLSNLHKLVGAKLPSWAHVLGTTQKNQLLPRDGVILVPSPADPYRTRGLFRAIILSKQSSEAGASSFQIQAIRPGAEEDIPFRSRPGDTVDFAMEITGTWVDVTVKDGQIKWPHPSNPGRSSPYGVSGSTLLPYDRKTTDFACDIVTVPGNDDPQKAFNAELRSFLTRRDRPDQFGDPTGKVTDPLLEEVNASPPPHVYSNIDAVHQWVARIDDNGYRRLCDEMGIPLLSLKKRETLNAVRRLVDRIGARYPNLSGLIQSSANAPTLLGEFADVPEDVRRLTLEALRRSGRSAMPTSNTYAILNPEVFSEDMKGFLYRSRFQQQYGRNLSKRSVFQIERHFAHNPILDLTAITLNEQSDLVTLAERFPEQRGLQAVFRLRGMDEDKVDQSPGLSSSWVRNNLELYGPQEDVREQIKTRTLFRSGRQEARDLAKRSSLSARLGLRDIRAGRVAKRRLAPTDEALLAELARKDLAGAPLRLRGMDVTLPQDFVLSKALSQEAEKLFVTVPVAQTDLFSGALETVVGGKLTTLSSALAGIAESGPEADPLRPLAGRQLGDRIAVKASVLPGLSRDRKGLAAGDAGEEVTVPVDYLRFAFGLTTDEHGEVEIEKAGRLLKEAGFPLTPANKETGTPDRGQWWSDAKGFRSEIAKRRTALTSSDTPERFRKRLDALTRLEEFTDEMQKSRSGGLKLDLREAWTRTRGVGRTFYGALTTEADRLDKERLTLGQHGIEANALTGPDDTKSRSLLNSVREELVGTDWKGPDGPGTLPSVVASLMEQHRPVTPADLTHARTLMGDDRVDAAAELTRRLDLHERLTEILSGSPDWDRVLKGVAALSLSHTNVFGVSQDLSKFEREGGSLNDVSSFREANGEESETIERGETLTSSPEGVGTGRTIDEWLREPWATAPEAPGNTHVWATGPASPEGRRALSSALSSLRSEEPLRSGGKDDPGYLSSLVHAETDRDLHGRMMAAEADSARLRAEAEEHMARIEQIDLALNGIGGPHAGALAAEKKALLARARLKQAQSQRRMWGLGINSKGAPTLLSRKHLEEALTEGRPAPFFGTDPSHITNLIQGRLSMPEEFEALSDRLGLAFPRQSEARDAAWAKQGADYYQVVGASPPQWDTEHLEALRLAGAGESERAVEILSELAGRQPGSLLIAHDLAVAQDIAWHARLPRRPAGLVSPPLRRLWLEQQARNSPNPAQALLGTLGAKEGDLAEGALDLARRVGDLSPLSTLDFAGPAPKPETSGVLRVRAAAEQWKSRHGLPEDLAVSPAHMDLVDEMLRVGVFRQIGFDDQGRPNGRIRALAHREQEDDAAFRSELFHSADLRTGLQERLDAAGLPLVWNGRSGRFSGEDFLTDAGDHIAFGPEKARDLRVSLRELYGAFGSVRGEDSRAPTRVTRPEDASMRVVRLRAGDGSERFLTDNARSPYTEHAMGNAVRLLQKGGRLVTVDIETDITTGAVRSVGVLGLNAALEEGASYEAYTPGFLEEQTKAAWQEHARKGFTPLTEEHLLALRGFQPQQVRHEMTQLVEAADEIARQTVGGDAYVAAHNSAFDFMFLAHRSEEIAKRTRLLSSEDKLNRLKLRRQAAVLRQQSADLLEESAERNLTPQDKEIHASQRRSGPALRAQADILQREADDFQVGRAELERAARIYSGLNTRVVDTGNLFQVFYPDRHGTGLEVLSEQYGTSGGAQTHTALDDLRRLAATLREGLRRKPLGALTAEELPVVGSLLVFAGKAKLPVAVTGILPVDERVGRKQVQVLGRSVDPDTLQPVGEEGLQDIIGTGYKVSQDIQQGRLKVFTPQEAQANKEKIIAAAKRSVDDNAARQVRAGISSAPEKRDQTILRARIARAWEQAPDREAFSLSVKGAAVSRGKAEGLDFTDLTDQDARSVRLLLSSHPRNSLHNDFFRASLLRAGDVLEQRKAGVDAPFETVRAEFARGEISAKELRRRAEAYLQALPKIHRADGFDAPVQPRVPITDWEGNVPRSLTLRSRIDGRRASTRKRIDLSGSEAAVRDALAEHGRRLRPAGDAAPVYVRSKVWEALRASAPEAGSLPVSIPPSWDAMASAVARLATEHPLLGASFGDAQDYLAVPKVPADFGGRVESGLAAIVPEAASMGDRLSLLAARSTAKDAYQKKARENRPTPPPAVPLSGDTDERPLREETPTLDGPTRAVESDAAADSVRPERPGWGAAALDPVGDVQEALRRAFTAAAASGGNLPPIDGRTALLVTAGVGIGAALVGAAARASDTSAGAAGASGDTAPTPRTVNHQAERDLSGGAGEEAGAGWTRLRVALKGTHPGFGGIRLGGDSLRALSSDVSATLRRHLGADLDEEHSSHDQKDTQMALTPGGVSGVIARGVLHH